MQLDLVLNEDQKKERFKASFASKIRPKDQSEVSTTKGAGTFKLPDEEYEFTPQTISTSKISSICRSSLDIPALIPIFSTSKTQFHRMQRGQMVPSQYPNYQTSSSFLSQEEYISPFPQTPFIKPHLHVPLRFSSTFSPDFSKTRIMGEKYTPLFSDLTPFPLRRYPSVVLGNERLPERIEFCKETDLDQSSFQVSMKSIYLEQLATKRI